MILRCLPLAGVLLLAPLPALAHTQEELDCVVRTTAPETRKFLVDSIAGTAPTEGAEFEAQSKAVYDMTNQCLAELGIPEASENKFFGYAEARLAQLELSERLAAVGVATSVIDNTLKIGPDGVNPQLEQLSESDIYLIEFALRLENVDVDALPDSAWEDMGGYISSASTVYALLAELK